MRKSYQAAYITLVLDGELRHSDPHLNIEAAISVICSGWASRFWTLEEVVLAQQPLVQFSSSSIYLKRLASDLSGMQSNGHDMTSWCKAVGGSLSRLGTWTRWSQDSSPELDLARRYSHLLVALESRSTSDPKDEPICLAAILGIPTESILNCRPDERMQEFWRAQVSIPQNILYFRGPKLQSRGLRWAPSSLLQLVNNNGQNRLWLGEDMATFTENGLDLASSAFRFASPGRRVDWLIAFRLPNGLHYQLVHTGNQLRHKDIAYDTMTSLAVLYRADFVRSTSGPGSMECVALVSITAEDENRIEASYLSVFMLLSDQRPLTANAASTCAEAMEVKAQWRIS